MRTCSYGITQDLSYPKCKIQSNLDRLVSSVVKHIAIRCRRSWVRLPDRSNRTQCRLRLTTAAMFNFFEAAVVPRRYAAEMKRATRQTSAMKI